MIKLTPEHLSFLERYGFDAPAFEALRRRVADGSLGPDSNLIRGRLEPPPEEAILDLPRPGSPEAERAAEVGRRAIARGELGVVILNGGMATRFGGVVKGVVEALEGRSFLGLKARDVLEVARSCGGRIKFHVLNSFATDEATRDHFSRHGNHGIPEEDLRFVLQFIAPRLTPSAKLFMDENKQPSFYAPGHGDFPEAMRRSGALAEFTEAGGKYLFVSNVDNLGARVSPEILGLHILEGKAATVEVAPKWPGDAGGAPALVDGELQVVEGFRFPPDFDQSSIPVFNCNTFTFTARDLDRDFDLTWFFVEKKVGGRSVVQIEHLVGELTRFLSCRYLRVKRTGLENRFFPIKTPEDLEGAREDLAVMLGLGGDPPSD